MINLYSVKSRFILLGILFLLTLILLIIYLNRKPEEKILQEVKDTPSVKQITADEAKKILPGQIDSILFTYGLKKEWINEPGQFKTVEKQTKKKQKVKEEKLPPSKETLWFIKEVSVPKDIPVSLVNLDITKYLSSFEFSSTSSEDPKTFNVTMKIYNAKDSSKKTLAEIYFIYNDKLKRDAADVCIILDKLEDIPMQDVEKILKDSEKYSVVLPDMVRRIDLQTVVLDSKRDYVIFAEIGNEEDITAEFRTDMREKDWRSRIRSICYEYDKAGGVILKNPRKIYRYENDILNEFSRYRLPVFKDTLLIKFSGEEKSDKKISLLFRDIETKANSGYKFLIYLVNFSAEDFFEFERKVFDLKKKGYKFLSFSDMVKKIKNRQSEKTEDLNK